MRNVKLICNPTAGRGRAGQLLPAISDKLKTLGISSEIATTSAPGEAIYLARQASQDGFALVIAVGGDGTVHEVANGLVAAVPTGVAGTLGVIPVGTGNDFAKMLKPIGDWQAACTRIAQGTVRRIDVARVNDRIFVNNVGIGFDAQVGIEAQKIRWLRGQAVYFAALARNMLFTYRTPQVAFTIDDLTLEQPITMCTIGNGRCSGGGFWLTPQAEIDDGLLDMCVVGGLSKPKILWLVPRVMKGTHTDHYSVRMLRARTITVTSHEPLPVHADGEIIYSDAHRLEIAVLPGKLAVIA